MNLKKALVGASGATIIFGSMALPALAKPPGAQVSVCTLKYPALMS